MKFIHIALGALILAPSAALGQSNAGAGPPAPCASPEYRQLDLWVGEWTASWKNADGTTGTGKNRITRDEYGSCVLTERFSMDQGGFRGFSISMYVKAAGEWRQTWMDNQGGYFDLYGGPALVPGAAFALETYRRKPEAPFRQMLWQDVKPDSFTWRWRGKDKADDAWKDLWVIQYTRAKGAAR